MPVHAAKIVWTLQDGEDFAAGRYSRGHKLHFDGGATVEGSASPHIVGKWAVPSAVDPEEMLVAALSSCHMLSFLHISRLAGFVVTAYRDEAAGEMAEITPGRHAVTPVTLHPVISWAGATPDAARLAAIHHEAHETCFIANSVKAEVVVAPPHAPAEQM